MLKINLLESTNLAFEMVVEGTSNSVDKAWIILETKDGFDIRIPAKYEDNHIRCAIPVLENIMLNGTAMLHLEVVVDGRYFRPISEEVQIGSGKQEVRILTKSKDEAFEAKKPATWSQFGTPAKSKKSAHQKEIEKKSKEYWDKQPEPEISNNKVGNAKLTKEETFDESLEALDKLKEKYTTPSVVEEFQFGKRFEEAFAQSKAEHDRKMREARALAGALLADVKPSKVTEEKASLDRLKKLLGK